MQDFLNLISFSSGVCFFVFRIAVILLSRRHSNHRRTKTGISVRPPVYTARPKTFDFVWIFHHIAVFVPDAVLFFIGRSLGYPFGNIAAALRVYGSLSATHWVRLWPQSRVWALWLYIAAAVIFLAGLIGAVFLPTDSHRTAATSRPHDPASPLPSRNPKTITGNVFGVTLTRSDTRIFAVTAGS
ncbi:hypothetical protein MYCTH_2135707, partial [Thermothelomyces thermophilus ATCC 42464]